MKKGMCVFGTRSEAIKMCPLTNEIIRFIIFLLITTIVCSQVVFSLQKRNSHIDELYNMRNCDVLVLGSSHAYVNLNGAVMYDNYGIASSCIAQGEQQIRMSYYSLKSALRYCNPQVVVFEVYMAAIEDDYGDLPNQYANALLSFPIYSNLDVRLEAMGDLKGTNYIEYISGIPLYHNDYKKWYSEGSKKEHTAGFMNGFTETKDDGLWDYCFSVDTVSNKKEIGEQTRRALLSTIELCKQKNINLVFVITPYQAPDYHMEKLLSVQDIALEYGIPFVDMNCHLGDIGINLEEDMYDWGHAKKIGEEKNSIWLGNWLVSNYSLKDHRGESDYKYWDIVSQERIEWVSTLQ